MSNVVMLTRIRLARNLKKYPFPCKMNLATKNQVAQQIIDAIKNSNSLIAKDFDVLWIRDLNEQQRISLVENHLVSPEFVSDANGRAVLLSKNRTMSIMINEEDHIRLQIIKKGFDLDGTYDIADKLDTLLDEGLDFAFDDKLGYLTQCPTNLGTGMRASVMLHLPALQKSQAMGRIAGNLQKLGLTIRGTYGEGTNAKGAMYQLSNQVTLGISEQSAIDNLKNIANQLVAQELQTQERMAKNTETQDKLWRSYGVLKNARMMSCDEAMDLLSNVRLGVNTGVITGTTVENIDDLIERIQPATMMVEKGEKISPADRDILRAGIIRDNL